MDPKAVGESIRLARVKLGWRQQRLADAAETDQTTVSRLEKGDFKRLTEALLSIARVLKIPLPGVDVLSEQRGTPLILRPLAAALGEMLVIGTAEGGQGSLIFTGPIDVVQRPPSLANVKDPYGILVTGESMIPAFRPGDTALVHPYLVPHPEDDVILEREGEDGARYGIIKTFLGVSTGKWRLRQWRPQRDFTRLQKEWPKCNVVVGKYSRR